MSNLFTSTLTFDVNDYHKIQTKKKSWYDFLDDTINYIHKLYS